MRAVVDPRPARLDELAGRDHCGMANEGDEIALAAGFDTQNAEAVSELWKVTRSTKPGRTSIELAVDACTILR
jgi:hypothetical protein